MKRMLQIGMTDTLGGIETFLMNYYRKIDKSKYQFDFVNIYNNNLVYEKEIMNLGGKIYNVSSYYKHPLKYLIEINKIIKENKYDIVYCNMNSAAMIYPLIGAKIAGAKHIVCHSHNSSSDKGVLKSIMHNINRCFIPILANHYFACSIKAGNWFFSKKIINSNSFKIIYNAIDFSEFSFNDDVRKKIRDDFGFKESTVVIGNVGRFSVQKNHLFLIDIFKKYYEKNPDSKMILIGVGPLYDKVMDKVKKYSLENNVLFLNKRNDVNDLYQAMDVFVMPSLYEGLPLVGVEAQIAGLPCLFSDTITDEVRINEKCNFIKLNSIDDWVDCLLNLKICSRNQSDFINKNKDNFEINCSTNRIIRIFNEMK